MILTFFMPVLIAKRISMQYLLVGLFVLTGETIESFSQSTVHYGELELIKKKAPEMRKIFKVGDRVKISLIDRSEKKGKIIQLDSVNIYLKKGTVAIKDIQSISKDRGSGLDALGGIIGAAGMIMIFANVHPASSLAGDQVKTETIILGSILTLSGVAMIYRKSYSQGKWQFHVITK